jgi:hypothetical protein
LAEFIRAGVSDHEKNSPPDVHALHSLVSLVDSSGLLPLHLSRERDGRRGVREPEDSIEIMLEQDRPLDRSLPGIEGE